MMKSNFYYYNIEDDLEKYPYNWVYIIIGGRNTGKTYSCLKSCYLNKRKFVFVKRTIKDVELLCSGSGKIGTKLSEFGIDLSPFKSINRDLHSNVKAFYIKDGIGGFWECDSDNVPVGQPIGYIIALSSVSKVKGFDLAECEWCIFDEFIPQPWERISRKEGEQVMDLYKTIARDREHRELEPLKLLCLANATEISNPVMNTLEITDIVANMQVLDHTIFEQSNRGIFIHRINDNEEFQEKEKESLIYKAMHETDWGRMAFGNEFAYNDFTNVGKLQMKGFKPWVSIIYKRKQWYVYMKEGLYYMTTSRNDKAKVFNLNLENEQKLFYTEYGIDLRNECINGKMIFETYTMYDVIVNYKKFFKL